MALNDIEATLNGAFVENLKFMEMHMRDDLRHSVKSAMTKFLTVGYLLSAFAVTAATSKAGDRGVGVDKEVSSIYLVSSNCPGAITEAEIRTEGSQIVEAIDPTSSPFLNLPDFRQFGMPVDRMYVGAPVVAGTTPNNYTCAVSQQYRHMTQQGFERAVTIYNCILPTNARCAVTFEKLMREENGAQKSKAPVSQK